MGKHLKGKECGKVYHRKRTPMHCKIVLNRMDAAYAGSTIRQTYIVMGTMFRSAANNNNIVKHPMDGVPGVRRSRRQTALYARPPAHLCHPHNQKRYVRVTDDSLTNAVRQFAQSKTIV